MSPSDPHEPPQGTVPPQDRPPSGAQRQPEAGRGTAGASRLVLAWTWLRVLLLLPLAMMVPALVTQLLLARLQPRGATFAASLACSSVLATVLVASWWVAVANRPARLLGFAAGARRAAAGLAAGLALGALLMGAIAGVGLLAGAWTIRALPDRPWSDVLPWVGTLAVAAAFEEVLLRGYVLQELGERRPAVGIAFSSAVFAVLHVFNPGTDGTAVRVLLVFNITLAGLLLAAAFLHAGSLWLPIGMHAAINIVQALLLGLPVSGTELPSVADGTMDLSQPRVLASAFGPEASILSTAILLLAVIAWGLVLRRRGVRLPVRDGATRPVPALPSAPEVSP